MGGWISCKFQMNVFLNFWCIFNFCSYQVLSYCMSGCLHQFDLFSDPLLSQNVPDFCTDFCTQISKGMPLDEAFLGHHLPLYWLHAAGAAHSIKLAQQRQSTQHFNVVFYQRPHIDFCLCWEGSYSGTDNVHEHFPTKKVWRKRVYMVAPFLTSLHLWCNNVSSRVIGVPNVARSKCCTPTEVDQPFPFCSLLPNWSNYRTFPPLKPLGSLYAFGRDLCSCWAKHHGS